ncbi:hypothetical protein BHM03_00039023 [Ensete ventricosum]|nr:hypothetical protein BHM03_00039023 [Ensete ventricosum]
MKHVVETCVIRLASYFTCAFHQLAEKNPATRTAGSRQARERDAEPRCFPLGAEASPKAVEEPRPGGAAQGVPGGSSGFPAARAEADGTASDTGVGVAVIYAACCRWRCRRFCVQQPTSYRIAGAVLVSCVNRRGEYYHAPVLPERRTCRYIATLTRVPATSFGAKRTRRRLAIHARDVTPNPPMEIPFAPTRFFMPRPGIHPPFIADEID